MQHLTLEALARLVDETPEAHEESHVAACAACREELEALRAQTDALGTLPNVLPPPDVWPAVRRRMRAEGVIRGRDRRWTTPTLTRLAAALALFMVGGGIGYAVRGIGQPPVDRVTAHADAATDARIAAGPGAPSAEAASTAALNQEVERTQEMFAEALDRFMQASGTEAPDPAARLAALDHIVITTAEALNESPADPVLNSYHLTAVAQRRELIRQLSASREPVF